MSSALVIYSWPRLWSLGTGQGSPDFLHSLLSMTRTFERVTLLYPREKGSLLEAQLPPGVRALGFGWYRSPLIRSPRGPRLIRALVFALNWPLRLLNYLSFNLAACYVAHREYAGKKYDLVSAHGIMGVPAAAWIAGSVGAPLVVRLFGISLGIRGFSPPVQIAQFEETFGFRVNAVRWIITDDGSGGREAAIRLGVPEDNVKMLRAAVDRGFAGEVSIVDRENYRRRLGLSSQTRLVLRVCRLWSQQYVERLIEALPATLSDNTPVAAVVIGDGPERGRLEKLAAGLGKNVIFTGALPNDKLSEHYAACDVYAATADRTNGGQSVLEALCHGLPVVALDRGKTSDLVRDRISGRLLAPDDPRELRRALEELLADDKLRAGLAAGARRIAGEEIPDTEQRLATEAEFYSELISDTEANKG